MLEASIFGILGGLLGNILFLPQIIKGLKTKSTRDLSAWTYILITFTDALFVFFGLLTHQPIIWIANIVGFLLALTVIGMKKVYG